MYGFQGQAEESKIASPSGESEREKNKGIIKAGRVANYWVLISLCLYLLLIGFNWVVAAGTETIRFNEQGAFSIAKVALHSPLTNAGLGFFIGVLFSVLPPLALTAIFIRSTRSSARAWCLAITLLFPAILSCVLFKQPFGFHLCVLGFPVEFLKIIHAVLTGAVHSGEWWQETCMICLFGGLALWSLSWLAVPMIGGLKVREDLPPNDFACLQKLN